MPVKRRRSSVGGKAAKRVKSNASSAKKAQRKKRAVLGNMLSEQRDIRVDYVAKRKKYNKRDVAFKSKVLKAMAPIYPKVGQIFTPASITTATTATTEQTYQIFHMRPWRGTASTPGAGTLYNEPAQDDLYNIWNDNYTNLASTGTRVLYSELDVTVKEGSSAGDTIVEFYEIGYVRRKGHFSKELQDAGNLNTIMLQAITDTTTQGGASALGFNSYNVNPFDVTALLKNYGIKVMKKTTVKIGTNETTNYVMKDYRKIDINATGSVGTDSEFFLPKQTKSLLIISRNPTTAVHSIITRCVKRYRCEGRATQELVYGGED